MKKINTKNILPLTSDYVFKRIFGKGGNEAILKDLLESILKIDIKSIELQNTEIPKETISEKTIVLDIKAELNNNTIADIEMQVGNKTALEKRLLVYASKIIAGGVKVTDNYKNVKNTIIICIIKESIIKRNSYLNMAMLKFEKTEKERCVNLGYEKEEEYLTDMLKCYIIELSKFEKKHPKIADRIEKWLFVIGGNEEKMEEYKNEEGEIKEAIEQLEEMSADENERYLYELRERGRLMYNTEIAEAKNAGKEEGKKEGKIEIAKKLLNNGMAIKDIVEITDLTEREIKSLQNM